MFYGDPIQLIHRMSQTRIPEGMAADGVLYVKPDVSIEITRYADDVWYVSLVKGGCTYDQKRVLDAGMALAVTEHLVACA